ncbi:poliovirus receptor-like [Erethizon dorsatum]
MASAGLWLLWLLSLSRVPPRAAPCPGVQGTSRPGQGLLEAGKVEDLGAEINTKNSASRKQQQPIQTPRIKIAPLRLLRHWAGVTGRTETLKVQVLPQVVGRLGESVTLPCQLQSQNSGTNVAQLTWVHQKLEGPPRTVAVFHPELSPRDPKEPERVRFAAAKVGGDLRDASLTVSELRVEDEGTYQCHIATYPQGTASAETQLLVLVSPRNRVELQEVSPYLISRELVPVARCISEGGRPPARVSWHLSDLNLNETTSGNQEQEPGPLPGTVTITSLLPMVPSSHVNGKNVTCKVEHKSLVEPALLPVTLSVPYLPDVSISGYDDNWYFGRKNVTLNCEIHSNPEPVNVVWNTTMGTLPHSAEVQGRQLLIQTVDESTNTTFVCLVTNAVGMGQGKLTILLKEPPLGEQSDHTTAIIIGILVPVAVVGVGTLIYCCCRRPCGCCWSSSLVNKNRVNGVSYSEVNNRIHFLEDTR